VDDRLLSVGSANCTNRSMSFDSELNVSWEDENEQGAVSAAIARVRGSLLCEHAGIEHQTALERIEGLTARLDALVGRTRLRARAVPESPDEVPQQAWLELAFDPRCALTEVELDELLAPRRA
jgi:phospholipase D1/2